MENDNWQTVRRKIRKIAEEWFLTEPVLFGVFCTHEIVENKKIPIPMRTGKKRIEINSDLCIKVRSEVFAEYLKIEMFRILLKHPYERVPSSPNTAALAVASDITISDNYETRIDMAKAKDFGLETGLSYEEYYSYLKYMIDDRQISSIEKFSCCAELWDNDDCAAEIINSEIEKAQWENNWGSVPGKMQQMIEATLIIPMDYRKMLCFFRQSILSQEKLLTRMKPSRRYGFENMGSRRKFTTKLLVAVDTSGSIDDEDLQNFFSIINRFFKYGIETVDVIQFDHTLQGNVMPLKKAKQEVRVTGRGGTNFQPPIDYYIRHAEYDGLIMFTDGYAFVPYMEKARRILWVFTSKREYEDADWIEDLPASKATYIPRVKPY